MSFGQEKFGVFAGTIASWVMVPFIGPNIETKINNEFGNNSIISKLNPTYLTSKLNPIYFTFTVFFIDFLFVYKYWVIHLPLDIISKLMSFGFNTYNFDNNDIFNFVKLHGESVVDILKEGGADFSDLPIKMVVELLCKVGPQLIKPLIKAETDFSKITYHQMSNIIKCNEKTALQTFEELNLDFSNLQPLYVTFFVKLHGVRIIEFLKELNVNFSNFNYDSSYSYELIQEFGEEIVQPLKEVNVDFSLLDETTLYLLIAGDTNIILNEI
ncbi:hypothetical protein [Rickettsiales endosymbiont of Trichoplax sp. H2]|uniref:hypothetical protein n=1 Tax=Rickettsiales endosymbiont of Trichoplax sp. H2 TaxID=2021221 RepID=UPI0012B27256|nr:hypothetical protein [Rickettsiales endosymbiont of Trichoplax sp. H2]MSO13766.1 hypothetical protein [Rickettsiales endosymbiont of Trichoplax sp. H2]